MDLDKYFVKSELIPAIIHEKSTGEVLHMVLVKKPSGALEQGCNIRSFTKGN